MTAPDRERHANELAAEALAAGDPTGWFERLYAAAGEGAAQVPWDHHAPRELLVSWAARRAPKHPGGRALVVGCGLGDDAEFVSGLGFATEAFDVSPTAIRLARERHPGSAVRYRTADLLDPPRPWHRAFDLVVESLTVQSLPDPPRAQAIAAVSAMVAPGGTLVVIASAREPQDTVSGPPWPLTRAELESFATDGLYAVAIEDLGDRTRPGERRWRAEFERR